MIVGAAGAYVAAQGLTGILGAVAWAFCFANSGLFFPLVLGVWWKRANRAGAVAGMIGGFSAGAWYLYMVQFGGMTPWCHATELNHVQIPGPCREATNHTRNGTSPVCPFPPDAKHQREEQARIGKAESPSYGTQNTS